MIVRSCRGVRSQIPPSCHDVLYRKVLLFSRLHLFYRAAGEKAQSRPSEADLWRVGLIGSVPAAPQRRDSVYPARGPLRSGSHWKTVRQRQQRPGGRGAEEPGSGCGVRIHSGIERAPLCLQKARLYNTSMHARSRSRPAASSATRVCLRRASCNARTRS